MIRMLGNVCMIRMVAPELSVLTEGFCYAFIGEWLHNRSSCSRFGLTTERHFWT